MKRKKIKQMLMSFMLIATLSFVFYNNISASEANRDVAAGTGSGGTEETPETTPTISIESDASTTKLSLGDNTLAISNGNVIVVSYGGTTYTQTVAKTDKNNIDASEKGLAWKTEGGIISDLYIYDDVLNNPDNLSFTADPTIDGYKSQGDDYVTSSPDYMGKVGDATLYFDADKKQYVLKDADGNYIADEELAREIIKNGDLTEIKESANAAVVEGLKNNNLLTDGWFDTPGMIKTCSDVANADTYECKAYNVIISSESAHKLGIGVTQQLEKLANEMFLETMTQEEALAKAMELLASVENGNISVEALEKLNALIDDIEERLVPECEDGTVFNEETGACVPECEDGLVADATGACHEECEDGTTWNFESQVCQEECPDGQAWNAEKGCQRYSQYEDDSVGTQPTPDPERVDDDVVPTVTLEPTPTKEPVDIQSEVDCPEGTVRAEDGTCKIENPITVAPTDGADEEPTQDEKDELANQAFNELDAATSSINKDLFGENYNPIVLEANGLTANLYIKSVIDLMSTDEENYSSLTANTDGTFSTQSTDEQNGEVYTYSKAYDANGELITDLVISSMQYGYIDFDVEGSIVSGYARLVGSGNVDSYKSAGLGSNTVGEKTYKYIIESDYKNDATKDSRKDMIVTSITSINQEVVNDAVKAIIAEAAIRMEEYNYNSYTVGHGDVETTGVTLTVTLVNHSDDRQLEVAEDGVKATYGYSMNQIVESSEGTTYALEDVMKHNIYALKDIVNAGFVVYKNGTALTVDTLGTLTYEQLLQATSIPLTGTEDNDDVATPDDGIERELTTIGDQLTEDIISNLDDADPEYFWSTNNYDYYIPSNVLDKIELSFLNKETGEYDNVTVAEALARGYISISDLQEKLEEYGITVTKVENSTTKASFVVITKSDENGEYYVQNITKFWEDSAYEYAFCNAEIYDKTYIMTSNGLKYTLDYVLNHNVYTIEELIEGGLDCYQTPKVADIIESMTRVNASVYNITCYNDEFIGNELYTTLESTTALEETLITQITTEIGDLETFFNSGKSFVLYGVKSPSSFIPSYATGISVKGDTIYTNIGYNTDEAGLMYADVLSNPISIVTFTNEDVLTVSSLTSISEMKLSMNAKDSDTTNEEDEDGGIILGDDFEVNVVYKPVIYLYPETKTSVDVALTFDGKLLTTYPSYEDGWKVTANPNGVLVDEKTNKEYSYLFYDAQVALDYDLSKGACVKGSDTKEYLTTSLTQMGMTKSEINDFLVFWLPLLQSNNYNLISFQNDVYANAVDIDVNGATVDSELRVYMIAKALDTPIDVEPQTFDTFERNGFSLVEWGGTILK